jgi:hypothetical protein
VERPLVRAGDYTAKRCALLRPHHNNLKERCLLSRGLELLGETVNVLFMTADAPPRPPVKLVGKRPGLHEAAQVMRAIGKKVRCPGFGVLK